MTVGKVLILLAVLVIVLFAISLALSSRNSGLQADPQSSRLNMLARPQKFDLSEVSSTNGWQNGQWFIPNGVIAAALDVAPGKRPGKIRRLHIGLEQGPPFRIEFKPRHAKDNSDDYADAEAIYIQIKNVLPSQRPIELTILEHGGTLRVWRDSPLGPAAFKLE